MMRDVEIREVSVVPTDEVTSFVRERVPLVDAGLVRSMFTPQADVPQRYWEVRESDGALAGVGLWGKPPMAPESWRFVYVVTRRDLGGKGLGVRLWSTVCEGLDDGAEVLGTAVVDGDEPAAAAAASWGFTLLQHSVTSELDLTGLAPLSADLGDGVTFEACDDLRFDDDDAVAAMLAASQTNPEAEAGIVSTLENLRTPPPAGQRMVAVVTRVDGRPAAISYAVADGDEMHIHYTGVDAALRGRALGRRTKEFMHHHAASQGVRLAITDNEDGNAGIRRVNEQLGYVYRSGWSFLITPAPSSVVE
jgi:GNAT superfamily N-acetyltransferase